MDHASLESEARFQAYVEGLASVIGHADRKGPLRDYCTGLLLPAERKSVEPMAAMTAPERTSAQHQSMLHFVGKAPWSDVKLLAKVRDLVLPTIEGHGPIRAWIVDDTAFPKKGKHSVGVTRQYCGQLGKQDNCQVAVTLSIANDWASLPVAYRLYLPEVWAGDVERRAKAGVPEDVVFQTKPQIALQQIQDAQAAGVSPGVLLADAGYGVDTAFRDELTALGIAYVVGVQGTLSIWPPGQGPLPAKAWSGRGRPTKNLRRDEDHQPVSAKAFAVSLGPDTWETIAWREGTNTTLRSRFARVRVRPAHRDMWRAEPRDVEWLIIEWPEGEEQPSKYWLSTLPDTITFESLLDYAKLRWRIERDYQDLKQDIGLSHYEGRGWRGFHHHAALCIAAYGFLISERETIPPSGPRCNRRRPPASVPESRRPRGGANLDSTPCRRLDPDSATTIEPRPGAVSGAMSMLRDTTKFANTEQFVTQ
jgi:SRSO17 transposase